MLTGEEIHKIKDVLKNVGIGDDDVSIFTRESKSGLISYRADGKWVIQKTRKSSFDEWLHGLKRSLRSFRDILKTRGGVTCL